MNQIINNAFQTIFLLTLILLSHLPQSVAEETPLTEQQIKQDFIQLYQDLQQAHYNLFANTSKEKYDRAFKKWLSKFEGAMSVKETQVLFQQFMALADIAHSRIDLPMQDFSTFMQNGGKMFPLFVNLSADRAFVETVYVDHQWLQPGDEILAINHKPVKSWLQDIRSYISADNATLANTIIENTLPYYLWLMLGEQDTFSIETRMPDGSKQFVVNAVNSKQRQSFSKSAVKAQDLSTQHAEILAGNIGYLRPGPFYNTTPGAEDIWDNRAFVSFVDEAFQEFLDKEVHALVIDLRNNPGGTNSFSDPIIAWFAHKPFKFASEFVIKVSPQSVAANNKRLEISKNNDATSQQLKAFYDSHKSDDTFTMSLPDATPREGRRFSKPVFVLINRYSYSNAVSFAAIVQDYGFGTVLGEKTADLATTYGAMEHFDLKHSGITVGYPKALIIRPNGDKNPDGVSPDVSLLSPFNESEKTDLLEKALICIKDKLNIN